MALTDEEKLVQSKVLSESTSDNENMNFTSSARSNKALNPNFFSSGPDSKIVNAMNALYQLASGADSTATNIYNSFAEVLLDANSTEGTEKFEQMKEATGQPTVVESVTAMAKDISQLKEGGGGEGGGSAGGITAIILEEPVEEEPIVCEHNYVEGVCVLCGEPEI